MLSDDRVPLPPAVDPLVKTRSGEFFGLLEHIIVNIHRVSHGSDDISSVEDVNTLPYESPEFGRVLATIWIIGISFPIRLVFLSHILRRSGRALRGFPTWNGDAG